MKDLSKVDLQLQSGEWTCNEIRKLIDNYHSSKDKQKIIKQLQAMSGRLQMTKREMESILEF